MWRKAICLLSLQGMACIAPAAAEPQGPGDGAPLEPLTVTGTRLAREPDEQTDPITTLDRASLLATGQSTLGEALNELPFMSGSPLGTTVGMRDSGGGFSRGIETVELRGLGPERTLVLVNGRRFVPGGNGVGGVVDLAMIPIAMVDRVEILRTGASVEYGADAVAGVVNVITRRSFDGLDLRASASRTDSGDADTYGMSAVWGSTLERGQVVAGLDFFDQDAVGKGERAFSRSLLTVSGPRNEIVPDGSSAPPNGNFNTSQGRLTLIDGADGDSPDDFRPFVGDGPDNDRYNFNPFEDLLQDSRRLSAFVLGRYDIADDTGLFAEASWQQRDSDTRLAPLPFFTNRLANVMVSEDNFYNPFDEEMSDARRRLVESGPREFIQDNDYWRLVLGADGRIGRWFWDTSINHGENRIEQRQTGDLLADRVALALGPSFQDGTGTPMCGTPAEPVAGCVPLNLFGGPGSITADMLAYVGANDLSDRSESEQTVFNANTRGDLLELPAGPLIAAFGVEYRDENAADVPDPETRAGNTTGAARAITDGGFNSRDVYAEFGVPLLSDSAYGQALDLEFGARAVDFSNFDRRTVLDTGLRYLPIDELELRAAWSTPFRAPTVGELFGGLTQSNPAVDDPCADFSQLTPVEIDRCVAQGVPPDGSFDQTGNETPQLGGGNPALEPEDGRTFTAGITYRPNGIEDLEISLDYYDIRIDDGIASLGANTILEQCLATGADQFCGNIARDDTGAIVMVRSELQNIARETARGFDLAAHYRHDAPLGSVAHALLLSYVDERELVAFPGAAPFVGAGQYDPDKFGAIPRWRGQYRLSWALADFELGYAAQWIGKLEEEGGELFPGTVNRVGERLYHDVSLAWNWRPVAQFVLGVRNATDEDPPFLTNGDVANTDVSTYRLLGRSFLLRFRYTL